MRHVSRRQFVTAAGVGLAAAAFGPYIKTAKAQPGPNDRIRLGIIGYGGMGRGDLAAFLRNAEVQCAVVCDVDESHVAKGISHVEDQGGNTPDGVTDFRRVVEREDLDAVLVATPDHWHALPTVYACQTGKDVYVEKPLARTIDEGRAILDAARDNKRVVQMGTQWRSGMHYADAVAFVQSGKLGPIRSVRGWSYKDWNISAAENKPVPDGVDYDLWLGPAPERTFNPNRFHRNFRWYWDYAGGLMTDLGVHVINLCQWATGPATPLRVASVGALSVLDGVIETPDTQTTIYDFPEYTFTWEHHLKGQLPPHHGQSGAWICGTKGAVLVSQSGWEAVPDPAGGGAFETEKHEPANDDRAAHVRNFLDCMASREQPLTNPEIGHHVTTLAHLGNIAYRTGTEIEWDAEAERITNNADADALVGEPYRAPWELPYARRTR